MNDVAKKTSIEDYPPMLTLKDASSILQIPRRRLYDLLEEWSIPHTRFSERRIRIPRDAFKAWINSRTTGVN